MCGISGLFGRDWRPAQLAAMCAVHRHRGPDAEGSWCDSSGSALLGHNRLSIIDLSDAGRQPMSSPDGRFWIAFNGEIYNYLELREELGGEWRTRTDTEVILAAYQRWGVECVHRLEGMFAFLLWDCRDQQLLAVRDRFGVKPLYYHAAPSGSLALASEIKALHAAGVVRRPDSAAWATYLAHGLLDHSDRTFWSGVRALPAGHCLAWRDGALRIWPWYDLAAAVGPELDSRSSGAVYAEYREMLLRSVRLRFRADVPVGINLSGGVDSSTLLGVVQQVQGEASDVRAFTFITGDARYDELPWVRQMLARTCHPSEVCCLAAEDVPALAASVQRHQDEPFGGLPTLAYARLFERARETGTIVLLDGQGMDEQWAGYDYYAAAAAGRPAGVVQGAAGRPVRPDCLAPDFRALAEPLPPERPFGDPLRDAQFRDIRRTKIPRALRFNDRVSMRASTELREPFLDHRLVELALRQPPDRKIFNGTRKRMLREIAAALLPAGIVGAPKRPLQTPQREWLRGPLRSWAEEKIESALSGPARAWFDPARVRGEWHGYAAGGGDNSYFVWQWISAGLLMETI
jgi:asparagine synthase (glutamine-hydrolysing)